MRRSRTRLVIAWLKLALLPVTLLICGCSSFNHAWREAGKTTTPTNSILGRWEGKWVSGVNGHNGTLRCIITEAEAGSFDARFRATYMKILKFSYTVPLSVMESNGVWQFTGQEDLGSMAGGMYHYEGHTSPTEFQSTYRSKYDQGVFEMKRPQVGP